MENWNRTGKIKTLIILIMAVLYANTGEYENSIDSMTIGKAVVIGSICWILFSILLIVGLQFWKLLKYKFYKADWNKNPFKPNLFKLSILTAWQFFGYFLVLISLPKILLQLVITGQIRGENMAMFAMGLSFITVVAISPHLFKIQDPD